MESVKLKQVDKMRDLHLQAWLTFAAKATKGRGKNIKPVYGKFKHFYNYEEELAKLEKPEQQSRFQGIGKLIKKGD